MIRISFIAIGNELLKGRIVNTNATHAAGLFRTAGFSFSRVLAIADTEDAITQAVESELAAHDIVLISGGLGPTKDDITKHTLAKIFNSKLILDSDTLERIKERFRKRNRVLTEANKNQALVPEDCEVIPNYQGTASGMLFRRGEKILISMPGVPFEMLTMLEHEVIPRISKMFPAGYVAHEILRLHGIPESYAADRIATVEKNFPPEIAIAYLPRNDGLWIELSVQVAEEQREVISHALQTAKKQLEELFAKELYIVGDQLIESHLGAFLKERNLTIAVAESITGGKIAAKIVSISGASNYFKGSVTAYDVTVKTQLLGVSKEIVKKHTVVSEPVAAQMAEGVRKLLGADIGLATTGIAEVPSGSNEYPHLWIGYSDDLETSAQMYQLLTDRLVNIERAANYALIECWKKLRAHFE